MKKRTTHCALWTLVLALQIFTLQVALSPSAHSAPSEAVTSPKPGSALRSAILNALRVPVSRWNKTRVTFTNVSLRASRNWAYVEATTVNAKGKPVGPPFNKQVSALLGKSNGKWRTLEWIYASDVISIEWEEKYPRVPKKIWPHRR